MPNMRWVTIVLLISDSLTMSAQVGRSTRTLVINGKPGPELLEMDGRTYVDLEALAQSANGSLSFKGRRAFLTLPLSEAEAETSPRPKLADDSGLSRDFMKAGIEAIAGMREWASTLAYAIQNGYQVTEGWASDYRARAAQSVKIASISAVTEGDRNAAQLLNHEFESVEGWSDKLVQARTSMDAAKYVLSADALRSDPLSEKIISCGRFLVSMLGSGNFQDDGSCH